MEYYIYTFGNGAILKGLFDALATCLNSEDGSLYGALIRLTLIIGGLWAFLYALYGDYLRAITHWIFPMTLMMQLLFVPQARLWIHDPVNGYHQSVDHVPYGLAMMAGTVSEIGFVFTEQIEKVFRLPDDLKYQKTGTLFASHLIQQSRKFHITNEFLAENLRQFVGQCVVYDAFLGAKYTLHDLKHSADIWGLVSASASPARSFLWRDLQKGSEGNARPRVLTCSEGVKLFEAAWKTEIPLIAQALGTQLFAKQSSTVLGKKLLDYLGLSYATLTQWSVEATQILQQHLMIDGVLDGFEQSALRTGAATQFATRRAALQQRATYQTVGALAAEMLPSMKAVLEALTYGAFLFVIPLSLLPFGFKFLVSWLQMLVWLQMWAPLYAILNYVGTLAARFHSIAALSISNKAGVTIASSVGLVNANADIAAMAGYLSLSIPFLCIALVKGVSSLAQMAASLSQVTQSVGAQMAQERVSGNYSFGNVGVANRQWDNTQMLNHSYGASFRSGSFHQADGRRDVMTSSDGQQILNIASSNIPFNLNVAETLQAQRSEQAGISYQKALNETKNYVKSMGSVFRQSADFSTQLGDNTQLRRTVGDHATVEKTEGLNQLGQIIKDFSKDNQMGEQRSAQILAAAAFSTRNMGVGPVASGGAGQDPAKLKALTEVLNDLGIDLQANINVMGNANKQDIYNKALKAVETQDFQDAFRATKQVLKGKSWDRLSDEGKRFVENVTPAWEEANHAREEAAKSFRESEDYQKQASYISGTGSTINANYTQQFVEWLFKQVAQDTDGRSDAAAMIANNPQLTSQYAQRFLAEKGLSPQKPKEIPDNPEAFYRSKYANENREAFIEVNKETALKEMDHLREKAAMEGLRPVHDDGLEEQFKAQEARVQSQIAQQKKLVEEQREKLAEEHHKQMRKNSMFVAAKQELLHVWDGLTHGFDLLQPPYHWVKNRINQLYKNRSDEKNND